MDKKQMMRKMALVLFLTILALGACIIYWLVSSGRINLKKASKEATDIVQNQIPSAEDELPLEEVYTGDKLVIYVSMGVSREDMDEYAEYFGGIISDDSSEEDGCYIITLKDHIPEENKPYFLKEVRLHIGIDDAYFTD